MQAKLSKRYFKSYKSYPNIFAAQFSFRLLWWLPWIIRRRDVLRFLEKKSVFPILFFSFVNKRPYGSKGFQTLLQMLQIIPQYFQSSLDSNGHFSVFPNMGP